MATKPSVAPESAEQQRRRLAALWQRIGLEFVSIPGGEFEMQTRGGVVDQHPERVAGFFLGRHEVTVGQFRSFVEATGYRTDAERAGGCRQLQKAGYWEARGGVTWRDPGFPQRDDHPVVCVSWDDVQEFCAWAGVRLPTEAEWELAAGNGARWATFSWGSGAPEGKRSGNLAGEEVQGIFGWGGVGLLAGHDDGHQHTAPVGSYEPDGLGLFDMTGNVLEWTSTSWRESSGATYALRGGSWQSVADNAQVASATSYYRQNKSDFIGFRVARNAP